jgi:hypothetical protein
MFLDLVCQYFVEDFCISIHKGYWSTFLVVSLPGLGIKIRLASLYDLEVVLFSSVFEEFVLNLECLVELTSEVI